MSKISLYVNEKLQFKSKFGIKINQYSNYIDTLEVKFDYPFKTSSPAIYLYAERNDKSTNTLYSTQLILNTESNCYEYQFGSNDGDVNGSWFTAIPGPLKISFEIIDGDDRLTTDRYSIWVNASTTSSNDTLTLNANEFNNIINFVQSISDSNLSKSEYDINKNWHDVEEDFAEHCISTVKNNPKARKIFFDSIGETEEVRKEVVGLVEQDNLNNIYTCIVLSPVGINTYMQLANQDYPQLVFTNINRLQVNNLDSYNEITAPAPTSDRGLVNKWYLEQNYIKDLVHKTGDETITGVKTFENEGSKPPIRLKSDMPYVVSDTAGKVGMRAYTEDEGKGQMAGQFAIGYDESYDGHFANIQARCKEDEVHTLRTSHLGPTYHIAKNGEETTHKLPFDENVVHNTGNETINGEKTFASNIRVDGDNSDALYGSKQMYVASYEGEGYLASISAGKRNTELLIREEYEETKYRNQKIVVSKNDESRELTIPYESGTIATEDFVKDYSDNKTKNKADKSEVPTKTSQLTNDIGFIDRLVSNLANYYLKNETYSKEEITSLLSNFRNISFKPVDSLPEAGEEQVIYLVPKKDGVSPDIKEEYIYINDAWELIGNTSINLSNYLTVEQGDQKYALNSNTYSFAEVSINSPKSLTIKNVYDSIISQLTNQTNDVILLRLTGYMTFTGFAEIRYVGAYLTSLYSFKDNKFVSNYYSADTYIDDILNSLSANVDVSSEQEISGTKIFNILKASSILLNDKEVALKEDIPTDYVDLTSEQNVEAFKDFIAGIGINGIKILKDSSDRIVFYFGSTPKVKIGQLDTLFSNRLTPDASNTYDIGRSGVYWRDLYLSRYLTDGINSVAVSNIAQKNDFKTINGESIFGEGDIKISFENFKYVSTLPTTDISTNTIYVVMESGGVRPNVYNEYIYINDNWEKIGGSDYIDKTSDQSISGTKYFNDIGISGKIYFYDSEANTYRRMINMSNSYLSISKDLQVYNLFPENSNIYDLGKVNRKWKDLYLSGYLTDGTNSISISDIANKSSLSKENLVSIIGSATTELSGLMSATDKTRLETLVALLNNDDDNTIVDTIAEVLAIFDKYPEGADLVSALAEKANKDEVVDKTSEQTISGVKTFTRVRVKTPEKDNFFEIYPDSNGFNVKFKFANSELMMLHNGGLTFYRDILASTDNSRDIGSSNVRFKDLYLSGVISDGTNSVTVEELTKKGSSGEARPLKEIVESGIITKQLEPNKYYIFDSQVASDVALTLAEEDETYLDEFMGEIRVDESAINVTFPKSIRWNENGNVTNTDGVLTLEAKNTYLFSIANSLGLITNIPNPSLAKPITTLADGVLTWEEVEGAQKYEMYYNNQLKATVNSGETLSINVKRILDQYSVGGASFNYTLKAVSNYYTDSYVSLTYDKIVKLSSPKNLVLSDSTLTWDEVSLADSYEVYVGSLKAITITNNYIDLSTLTGYTGTYDVTVKAINANKPSVHISSELSESVSYTWEASA